MASEKPPEKPGGNDHQVNRRKKAAHFLANVVALLALLAILFGLGQGFVQILTRLNICLSVLEKKSFEQGLSSNPATRQPTDNPASTVGRELSNMSVDLEQLLQRHEQQLQTPMERCAFPYTNRTGQNRSSGRPRKPPEDEEVEDRRKKDRKTQEDSTKRKNDKIQEYVKQVNNEDTNFLDSLKFAKRLLIKSDASVEIITGGTLSDQDQLTFHNAISLLGKIKKAIKALQNYFDNPHVTNGLENVASAQKKKAAKSSKKEPSKKAKKENQPSAAERALSEMQRQSTSSQPSRQMRSQANFSYAQMSIQSTSSSSYQSGGQEGSQSFQRQNFQNWIPYYHYNPMTGLPYDVQPVNSASSTIANQQAAPITQTRLPFSSAQSNRHPLPQPNSHQADYAQDYNSINQQRAPPWPNQLQYDETTFVHSLPQPNSHQASTAGSNPHLSVDFNPEVVPYQLAANAYGQNRATHRVDTNMYEQQAISAEGNYAGHQSLTHDLQNPHGYQQQHPYVPQFLQTSEPCQSFQQPSRHQSSNYQDYGEPNIPVRGAETGQFTHLQLHNLENEYPSHVLPSQQIPAQSIVQTNGIWPDQTPHQVLPTTSLYAERRDVQPNLLDISMSAGSISEASHQVPTMINGQQSSTSMEQSLNSIASKLPLLKQNPYKEPGPSK